MSLLAGGPGRLAGGPERLDGGGLAAWLEPEAEEEAFSRSVALAARRLEQVVHFDLSECEVDTECEFDTVCEADKECDDFGVGFGEGDALAGVLWVDALERGWLRDGVGDGAREDGRADDLGGEVQQPVDGVGSGSLTVPPFPKLSEVRMDHGPNPMENGPVSDGPQNGPVSDGPDLPGPRVACWADALEQQYADEQKEVFDPRDWDMVFLANRAAAARREAARDARVAAARLEQDVLVEMPVDVEAAAATVGAGRSSRRKAKKQLKQQEEVQLANGGEQTWGKPPSSPGLHMGYARAQAPAPPLAGYSNGGAGMEGQGSCVQLQKHGQGSLSIDVLLGHVLADPRRREVVKARAMQEVKMLNSAVEGELSLSVGLSLGSDVGDGGGESDSEQAGMAVGVQDLRWRLFHLLSRAGLGDGGSIGSCGNMGAYHALHGIIRLTELFGDEDVVKTRGDPSE